MSNAPKKHAKFAASSAHRWLVCPGSIALSEGLPEAPESSYAVEGTLAHKCLEALLTAQSKSLSQVKKDWAKIYPADMIDHAWEAYSQIMRLYANAKTIKSEVLYETEVRLDFVHPDMFGTVDAAVIEPSQNLYVIDFKYGAGVVVDPTDNPQLAYYALGLAHKYKYNFKKVYLVIIQPRAESEKGPVRSSILTIEELKEWKRKFEIGVIRARENPSEYVAGDHCRWCNAKTICPELGAKAMKEAQIVFDPIDETKALVVPEVLTLTPVVLGRTLQAIEKLEVWIDAVKAFAHRTLEQGGAIDGYKLVAKRANRKWSDEENVMMDAEMFFGESAFSRKLLSPAQLEKVAGKDWVSTRTIAESSGVTMVPTSDKRQAIDQLDKVFDVIEN